MRSIREECLDRVIPLRERHLRRTLADFVAPTMANETTKGLEATSSSSVRHDSEPKVPFAGARVSVDFSVTTTVPPHSRLSSRTSRGQAPVAAQSHPDATTAGESLAESVCRARSARAAGSALIT